MKEEPQNHSIDPELEARVIALVLGEASDFERDEIERLIKHDPDLRAFKDQVDSVNGLLVEIGEGELATEDNEWKLPTKKRNTLLAVMSGKATEPTVEPSGNLSSRKRTAAKNSTLLWNLAKVAIAIGIVGIGVSLMMPASSHYSARQAVGMATSDEAAEIAGEAAGAAEDYDDGYGVETEAFLAMGSDAELGEAVTAARRRSGSTASTELSFSESGDSEPSVAEIRDRLAAQTALPAPYYLNDDAQYAPPVDKFIRPNAPTGGRGKLSEVQPRGSTRSRVAKHKSIASFHAASDSFGVNPQQQPPSSSTDNTLALPEISGFAVQGVIPNSSRYTVQVPDGETVLLGGNKGYAGVPTQPDDSNLSSPSRATRLYSSLDAVEPKSESVDYDTSVEYARQPTTGQEARDSDFIDATPAENDHFGFKDSTPIENDKWGTVRLGRKQSSAPANPLSDSEAPVPAPANQSFGFPLLTNESEPLQRPEYRIAEFDDTTTWELAEGEQNRGQQNDSGLGTTTSGGMGSMGGGMGGGGMGSMGGSWYGQTAAENAPLGSPVAGKNWVDRNAPVTMQSGRANQYFDSAADDVVRPNIQPSNEGGFFYQPPTASLSNSIRNIPANETVIATDGERGGQILAPVVPSGVEPEVPIAVRSIEGRSEVESIAKKALGRISELNRMEGISANSDGILLDDLGTATEEHIVSRGIPQQQEYPLQRGEMSPENEEAFARALKGKEVLKHQALNGRSLGLIKQRQIAVRRSRVPSGLNETLAGEEAFSTFSLHVSDVSFKLARTALSKGQWPAAEQVRIEEFVNAFDYGDPMPSQNEKVSCNLEQCIHPFIQQRNLLRVSMRTAAAGRNSTTPLRLTILLDNSGSMERSDRQQTVRRAFALLAQQLKPIDQVTVISFARQPRLLAESVSGAKPNELVQLIHNLPSEGGTNIEAALKLAFEKAQDQQTEGAQNRIVLLTDGAVNLGNANPDSLAAMVTNIRNAGIAFDAAGISADGLNDEVLEALTRKGDGRYYLLDSIEATDGGFAKQIAGALRPAAKNVKVQIEFNPQRVGRYKLLGFEKHRLKKEDFRNDEVDAAEMAAAEAGVAVYQFEAKPDGEGDVGTVFIRFRDQETGRMVERSWSIPYESNAPRAEQAAPSLRIATSAALLGAKLSGEPLGESVDLKMLSNLVSGLPGQAGDAQRIRDLHQMIEQARQLSGK